MSKFTLIKQAANLVVKHKSLIFKAVGIGMVVGGVAVGVKKGADLKEGIAKAQEEKGNEPLTKVETAKIAARYLWVPAALVTGGLTGLCYGYKIDIKELTKECATLTASYQGVKSAADALQENLNSQIEATKEIVGEEKAEEITKSANNKILKKNIGKAYTINGGCNSGNGEAPFYFPQINTIVSSTKDLMKKTVDIANSEMSNRYKDYQMGDDSPRNCLLPIEFIINQLGGDAPDIAENFAWDVTRTHGLYYWLDAGEVKGFDQPVWIVRWSDSPEYYG